MNTDLLCRTAADLADILGRLVNKQVKIESYLSKDLKTTMRKASYYVVVIGGDEVYKAYMPRVIVKKLLAMIEERTKETFVCDHCECEFNIEEDTHEDSAGVRICSTCFEDWHDRQVDSIID